LCLVVQDVLFWCVHNENPMIAISWGIAGDAPCKGCPLQGNCGSGGGCLYGAGNVKALLGPRIDGSAVAFVIAVLLSQPYPEGIPISRSASAVALMADAIPSPEPFIPTYTGAAS
jgi:hypothetical protein